MRHRIIRTFTGPFAIVLDDQGQLQTTWMNKDGRALLKHSIEDKRLLPELAKRVSAYFKGAAVEFDDLNPAQESSFTARCWRACQKIPRGQTRTYAQLAAMAGGKASASRAAGQAMRNNRMPIIVPCHRVIGADGKLHGFAGTCDPRSSALDLKRALLKLEGFDAS